MASSSITTNHIRDKSHLTKENIQLILRQALHDDQLEIEGFEDDKSFNDLNTHYNSNLVKLKLKLKNSERCLSVVVKGAMETSIQKMIGKLTKPFMREIFWLMEAYPALSQVYSEIQGISPQCYHAFSAFQDNYKRSWADKQPIMVTLMLGKSDQGLLVMEDLEDPHRSGGPMSLLDKTVIPNYSDVIPVMQTLAKFHGVWLAWLKNPNPSPPKIANLTQKQVIEAFKPPKKFRAKMFYRDMINRIKILENQYGVLGKPQDEINGIRKFRKTQAYETLANISVAKDNSKILTMIHGDFWSNNIFSGQSKQIVLIDFQFFIYGHPAKDILNYVYVTTDSKWRKVHFAQCLGVYYETFKTYLDQAGIKMTLEEFKKEVQNFRGVGLAMMPYLLPLILSPTKIDPMQSAKTYSQTSKELFERFSKPPQEEDHELFKETNRRLLDLAEEAFELGITEKLLSSN